jgi:hypothetical protein
MRKQTIPNILVALLVLGVLAPAFPTHAVETPDRHAEYVGFGHFNHGINDIIPCTDPWDRCPSYIPSGILVTECDDQPLAPHGPNGITGVYFCEIPVPSLIHLHIHDAEIEHPRAWVGCLQQSSPEAPAFASRITMLETQGAVEVSEDCVNHPDEAIGTTRISIALEGPPDGDGATHGSVHLNFL